MKLYKTLLMIFLLGTIISCTLQTRSVFVMKDYNLQEEDFEFNEFFDNIEDEYNLAKYFLTQSQIKAYLQTRKNIKSYLTQFDAFKIIL